MRRMVGQVLIAHGEMQIIGPYIPLFYQLDGQPSIDGSEVCVLANLLAMKRISIYSLTDFRDSCIEC